MNTIKLRWIQRGWGTDMEKGWPSSHARPTWVLQYRAPPPGYDCSDPGGDNVPWGDWIDVPYVTEENSHEHG